jgi:hypothetical protein
MTILYADEVRTRLLMTLTYLSTIFTDTVRKWVNYLVVEYDMRCFEIDS